MTYPMRKDKAERLVSLMSLLSGGHIAKGLLVKALCYNSMATFESDMASLRKNYNATISYDKKNKTYHLENVEQIV